MPVIKWKLDLMKAGQDQTRNISGKQDMPYHLCEGSAHLSMYIFGL